MTPKQIEIVQARVQQWVSGCPVCHQRNFTLGELAVFLSFKNGNVVLGGQMTPVVTIACATCGNVLTFAALQLGLVTADGKDVE